LVIDCCLAPHEQGNLITAVTWEWPYVPSNVNTDCENMKMLLNCFA